MALPQGNNPTVDGIWFRPVVLTAGTTAGGNTIPANCKSVDVTGVTTNQNDYIILPALSEVPVGHEITICCNAGSNFELRTPAASNEKINTVDSDGTQEYLCTDTNVVKVVKVSATDGWIGYEFTAAGAVDTAVVPD